jgi:cytochrome b involved in lipid metabolism
MAKHPGGPSWLTLTRGHDITEHFIAHHLNEEKARKVLEKYYVKDCEQKICRFTFSEDGFYRTLKRRLLTKYTV